MRHMLVLELYYRKISQEVTVMYIQDLWMALVTRYGKPDFFVTMTCNPYLDEIVRIVIAGSNTARSSRYSGKGL